MGCHLTLKMLQESGPLRSIRYLGVVRATRHYLYYLYLHFYSASELRRRALLPDCWIRHLRPNIAIN